MASHKYLSFYARYVLHDGSNARHSILRQICFARLLFLQDMSLYVRYAVQDFSFYVSYDGWNARHFILRQI